MPNTFDIKIKVLKFDKKGYTEALGKEVQVQIRQAARAWLRAVITRVPIYSGQARASLFPLGRYLRVAIDLTPDPIGAKRYPDGVAKGKSQGSYQFKAFKYTYTFGFSTEVPHYLINEFNVGLGSPPLRHPTPWHSLETGKIAFQQYLRDNLRTKIPKISDFTTLE